MRAQPGRRPASREQRSIRAASRFRSGGELLSRWSFGGASPALRREVPHTWTTSDWHDTDIKDESGTHSFDIKQRCGLQDINGDASWIVCKMARRSTTRTTAGLVDGKASRAHARLGTGALSASRAASRPDCTRSQAMIALMIPTRPMIATAKSLWTYIDVSGDGIPEYVGRDPHVAKDRVWTGTGVGFVSHSCFQATRSSTRPGRPSEARAEDRQHNGGLRRRWANRCRPPHGGQ